MAVIIIIVSRLDSQKIYLIYHQFISSSSLGNMFSCDQCEYKTEIKGMVNIHSNNLHHDTEYMCSSCGHHTLSEGGLRRHNQVVHIEKKYPCKECDHQTTSKSSMAKHQSASHECNSKFTEKGWPSTSDQFMKERSTHAESVSLSLT